MKIISVSPLGCAKQVKVKSLCEIERLKQSDVQATLYGSVLPYQWVLPVTFPQDTPTSEAFEGWIQ